MNSGLRADMPANRKEAPNLITKKCWIMKKLMIGFLLIGFAGLWSCQKDLLDDSSLGMIETIANDSSAEPLGTSDLPAAIVAYVNNNYSPLQIEMVFSSGGNGYEVILEDGQELYFGMDGSFLGHGDDDHGGGQMGNGHHGNDGHGGGGYAANCIEGAAINPADLPQAVLDYATDNYPGLSIATAVIKPSGKFGVEMSDGMVLLFDEQGAFIKECTGEDDPHGGGHHGGGHHGGGHHGGGHHGGETHMCAFGDTLALTDLPQSAMDYITENYPGEDVVLVVAKHNGDFAAELSGGAVLIFDEDGTFEHECGNHGGHGPGWGGTEITASELPAAAITYMENHYPGETVVLAILTFHEKYFVELSNEVKIVFDADGNVLFDSGN